MRTNKQFFIVATVLTGLFAYAGHYANHKQNSPARIVFGTFALGAVLSLIAEFNPYAANMMGLVTATTSFLINGQAFTTLLNTAVGPDQKTIDAGEAAATGGRQFIYQPAPSGDHAGAIKPPHI